MNIGGKINKVRKVTLIPGDGIGPEIIEATKKMINSTGIKINWETFNTQKEDTNWLNQVLENCKKNNVVLKGPLCVPKGGDYINTNWSMKGKLDIPMSYPTINNALRRALECNVGLRIAKNFAGVPSKYKNVDIVIIRELTEDVYIANEYSLQNCAAIALKVTTVNATEKACLFGFNFARKNKRRKVTIGHKANVLKKTDGLFLNVAKKIALDYPDIQFEDKMIDALCADIVNDPTKFDVIISSNQYGDILSDLCAAVVGGVGVSPGATFGKDVSIFESTHGAAPDIAGQNIANPTAMMLTGVLMLRHIGELKAAIICEKAIISTLEDRKKLTRDLRGNASTIEYTNAIIDKIKLVL